MRISMNDCFRSLRSREKRGPLARSSRSKVLTARDTAAAIADAEMV